MLQAKETGYDYAKYSLVKLGTSNINQGVLFNAYIAADNAIVTKRFDISGFSETSRVSDIENDISELLDIADWSDYTADIAQACKDFIFKQIPEDPFHYSISTETPKIYGWFDSNYVFELAWDENRHKFTPAEAYPIPNKFDWDGLPEHIDFGHKRFVIMVYMNCASV